MRDIKHRIASTRDQLWPPAGASHTRRRRRALAAGVIVLAGSLGSWFGGAGRAALAATVTQVQEMGATETAQSSTLTANLSTTTGDLLVVSANLRGVGTFASPAVTDSAGDTYATALTKGNSVSATGMFYAANASAVTSVTVHASGTATIVLSVQEFSGISSASPLDVSAGQTGTSTSPSSGTTALTSGSGELVEAVIGWSTSTVISGQSGGYTLNTDHQSTVTNLVDQLQSAYLVTATWGSQSYSATLRSSQYWGAFVVAFKSIPPAVSYTYDADGRLATVTTAQGTATYSYDPEGNLLSISRSGGIQHGPRQAMTRKLAPRITSVTASRAGALTTISISGEHFDAAAGYDRVRLGNLDVDVVSARPTRLLGNVPASAAPGAISVITPAGSAHFPATPSLRAVFSSGGSQPVVAQQRAIQPLRAARGQTALSGLIEDTGGAPLAGVTVSINAHQTQTNSAGQFLLTGLAAGHRELWIDATAPADGVNHGAYEEGVYVAPHITSVVPWTLWLPKLDLTNAVTIPSPTTAQIVYSSPAIPGLEVVIPKGTVIHDHYGRVVHQLSVTETPLDRTPLPLAPGMPFFYTLQPSDSEVSGPGLQVIYPNITRALPGTPLQFDDNAPSLGGYGWYAYGIGHVTANSAQIMPPPGLRLHYIESYSVAPNPLCQLLGFICPLIEEFFQGDPVEVGSGLFDNAHTDLALPDVLPIQVTRVYRQGDYELRAFGYDQSDTLDMFVSPDNQGDYDLQLPDGGDVPFAPGSGYLYYATGVPEYAGATLQEITHQNFLITLKDGTQYNFGTYHPSLTSIVDRYGDTTTIQRDSSTGELQQVTSANGRWITFTWGPCITGQPSTPCVTQVTDNTGRTVGYGYDGQGRLTSVTDANTQTTQYGWASCSGGGPGCTQITSITDPRPVTYLQVQYDSNGRVHQQTEGDGGTYQFSYTLSGSQITETDVTDPGLNLTKWNFDSTGYLASKTAAAGTSVQELAQYARDPSTHEVTDVTDALSRDTHFTYDALGNVLTVTQLYGTSQAETLTMTYEAFFNRLASVKDQLQHTTTLTYQDDGATGVMTVTDPAGNQEVLTTVSGQPTSITDPMGNTTYYSYLNGDLVAVADPDGNVWTRYLDAAGRVVQQTDADGNTTQYQVDALNQVKSITDPLNGVLQYFTYDANGNLTSVKDADGNLTAYAPNAMNQVGSFTDPLQKSASYVYDKMGNLSQLTDRNGTVDAFYYDALNRLSTADYGVVGQSQQSSASYTYDLGNRLTQVVDSASGTVTQGFDGFDDLTSQSGPNGTVSYTYWPDGRRETMSVSGGSTLTYNYDARGALTSMTGGGQSVAIQPDADERPATVTLPDGVVEAYGYDAASRNTSITDTSGSNVIGTLVYNYDPNGQRTSVDGTLASAILPATTTSNWQYNADNELTNRNGTALSYDSDGRLLNDGSLTYGWDDRGQLNSLSGAQTASFSYDPFGRRQSATIGGTTTGFLDDGLNVIQELSGSTPVASDLTGPGVDEVFSRTSGANTSSLLTDSLGSTLGLANASGSVTTRDSYEPYGAATVTGSPTTPQQFVGQWNDGTGLNYDNARYYSPTDDRFISQDPVGFGGGGTNLYSYAANDPINLTDPSGGQLLAGCAATAVISVVQDAWQALTGQKKTWQNFFVDAAESCALGMFGAGFGNFVDSVSGFFERTAADATVGLGTEEGGFSSFSAAKNALGSPGEGNVYDHIVEQSQMGRSGFSSAQINNPENLNPVLRELNQIKANYYSSKDFFTNGMTVRDWLNGQSFEDQWNFGMSVTEDIWNGVIR